MHDRRVGGGRARQREGRRRCNLDLRLQVLPLLGYWVPVDGEACPLAREPVGRIGVPYKGRDHVAFRVLRVRRRCTRRVGCRCEVKLVEVNRLARRHRVVQIGGRVSQHGRVVVPDRVTVVVGPEHVLRIIGVHHHAGDLGQVNVGTERRQRDLDRVPLSRRDGTKTGVCIEVNRLRHTVTDLVVGRIIVRKPKIKP